MESKNRLCIYHRVDHDGWFGAAGFRVTTEILIDILSGKMK